MRQPWGKVNPIMDSLFCFLVHHSFGIKSLQLSALELFLLGEYHQSTDFLGYGETK